MENCLHCMHAQGSWYGPPHIKSTNEVTSRLCSFSIVTANKSLLTVSCCAGCWSVKLLKIRQNISKYHTCWKNIWFYTFAACPRGRILGRNWDKSLRAFLLVILLLPPPPLTKSGMELVCNVNMVYGNLKVNLNEIVRSWIRLQVCWKIAL